MSITKLLSKKSKTNDFPDWVSPKNATHDAYLAINILEKEKLEFIKSHKRKSDFRTARHYQVQKSEVSNRIGITRQVLFNTSKYSNDLREYLEEINKELKKKKCKRLEQSSRSLQSKSKAELLQHAKKQKSISKDLLKNNAQEQLKMAIDKMSLSTIKKLGF